MSDAEDQDKWKNGTPEELLKEAQVLTEQFKATHDDSLVPRIQALRRAAHERRRVTPAEMQGEPSKFCVKCGNQLPPKSNYCDSCGVNQATPAKAHPVMLRPLFKWLLVATLGFFGIVFLIAICSDRTSSSQPDQTQVKLRVLRACEDHVRQYLKAPSTARFSSYYDTEVRDHGSGKYSAVGWVDSQNSFGAMLRTEYICTATDEGNDQWSFEPLAINDGSE
ncbi:MAG: zinc ribbon domain-containing protein [Terriglobia bacterium]|jgi:hypothetical protein